MRRDECSLDIFFYSNKLKLYAILRVYLYRISVKLYSLVLIKNTVQDWVPVYNLSIVRQPCDDGWLHVVARSLDGAAPALNHPPGSLGVLQGLQVAGHTDLAVQGAIQSPGLQRVPDPLPDGGVGGLQLSEDLVIFRFMDDQSGERQKY